MNQIPVLWKKKQAADALGISVRLLEMKIKSGEITPVKIGSRTLVDPVDLRVFIERQKASPQAGTVSRSKD